jgi:hypothetical protein
MTTPVIRITDIDRECNACLFIQNAMFDIEQDLTDEQKALIDAARADKWKVKAGQPARFYIANEGTSEEVECWERPEMVDICTQFDLWPERIYE